MEKILFISGHKIAKTGAHYRFDRLVEYAKNKYECLWLTPKREDLVDDDVICLDCSFKDTAKFAYILYFLASLKNFFTLFKLRGKISHIVVFGEHTLMLALFFKLVTKAKISVGVRSNVRKRYIIQRDELKGKKRIISDFYFSLKNIFLKNAYHRADQVIVQSEEAKINFIDEYKIPSNKVTYLYNDLPKIPEEYSGFSTNRIYKLKPESILFVGNATKIKGLDILLDAVIKTELQLKRIFIIGLNEESLSSSQKDCVNIARGKLDIDILGRKNNVIDYLLHCDLVIAPSREDQFPNVVLEALATLTPVIGSNVDGISVILKDDILLFEPHVDSLVSKLNELQKNHTYTDVIKCIKERTKVFSFNWEEKYFDILNEKYEK